MRSSSAFTLNNSDFVTVLRLKYFARKRWNSETMAKSGNNSYLPKINSVLLIELSLKVNRLDFHSILLQRMKSIPKFTVPLFHDKLICSKQCQIDRKCRLLVIGFMLHLNVSCLLSVWVKVPSKWNETKEEIDTQFWWRPMTQNQYNATTRNN